MTVELISVGTEILLGNIVNTNAAYLAEQCANLGLSLFYQTSVGDNEGRLMDSIKTAFSRADIVVLSGGLGPTADDLTKETAAKVLEKELVMHEESKKSIEVFFEKRGIKPTDNNWKQAMVPKDSIVVTNHNGTAPGIIIEEGDKAVILLPGPPNELKPMFEESIAPYLRKKNPFVIASTTVKVCGIGESKAETMVFDLLDKQSNPTLAPYAKTGEVHFRITAKAIDMKTAESMIKPLKKELKKRFRNAIYTTDEAITLEMAVVDLLKQKQYTVTTAESCTGGMLAARLINVSGVSDVFPMGSITYANKAKHKMLEVSKDTLKKHGAVSEETAKEMAKGAQKLAKTDVSVAITGIAGPEGGTKEKPVGLVYIACRVKKETLVRKYYFSGNRDKIRETTVASALILLREMLI